MIRGIGTGDRRIGRPKPAADTPLIHRGSAAGGRRGQSWGCGGLTDWLGQRGWGCSRGCRLRTDGVLTMNITSVSGWGGGTCK